MGFETVANDLKEMDYQVAAGVFSAAAVGAPHQRDRLFILATNTYNLPIWLQSTKPRQEQKEAPIPNNNGPVQPMADAMRKRRSRGKDYSTGNHFDGKNTGRQKSTNRTSDGSAQLAHPTGYRRNQRFSKPNSQYPQTHSEFQSNSTRVRPGNGEELGWWAVEPTVGRVAHGIPGRMDRLRALGNAVVPVVAARAFLTLAQAFDEI